MTSLSHSTHMSHTSKPLWRRGYVQVLVAAAAGAAMGAIWPRAGIAVKCGTIKGTSAAQGD